MTRSSFLQRGITMIECLVYMAVVTVVLGIGSAALYRCWDDNLAISRNSDDIVSTLKAGEAWRADIRSATGAIHITNAASGQTVVIPCGQTQITYSFGGGEVQKQAGQDRPWIVLLPKVKSSQMERDSRDHVTAWRWEVVLETRRKNAQLHPLFTFEAVPANSTIQ